MRLVAALVGLLVIALVHDRLRQSQDWRAYRARDGGYSVQVAGRVVERSTREEADGVQVTSHYLSFGRDDVEYAVAGVGLPAAAAQDEAPQAVLVRARQSLVERLHGQARDARDTVVCGYPASAFDVAAGDGRTVAVRTVLVGPRLYTLMAACPTAGDLARPEVRRFMDSFVMSAPEATGQDTVRTR